MAMKSGPTKRDISATRYRLLRAYIERVILDQAGGT
jgi:hypothetical protein